MKPEIALRRALHAADLRYRAHDTSLPGTPDISNKRRKVAIFVDGCFWHGLRGHFKLPTRKTEFLASNIRRNPEKRAAVAASYPVDWQVLEVLQCEIRKAITSNFAATAAAVRKIPRVGSDSS